MNFFIQDGNINKNKKNVLKERNRNEKATIEAYELKGTQDCILRASHDAVRRNTLLFFSDVKTL